MANNPTKSKGRAESSGGQQSAKTNQSAQSGSAGAQDETRTPPATEENQAPNPNPAEQPSPAELEKQEFEDQMNANRIAQNMSNPNAVPEQRPQAFLSNEGTTKESDLTRRLREAGDPNVAPEEPMDHEAYKRAGSKAQMKKAAESSKSEGIMVGNGVRATDGPHEGRIFAVLRVTKHGDVADMMRVAHGNPEQLYNQPSGLELRAIGDDRDGEIVVLEDDHLDNAKLEKLPEGFRGTRAGRLH
jgi:hypothetical protein